MNIYGLISFIILAFSGKTFIYLKNGCYILKRKEYAYSIQIFYIIYIKLAICIF